MKERKKRGGSGGLTGTCNNCTCGAASLSLCICNPSSFFTPQTTTAFVSGSLVTLKPARFWSTSLHFCLKASVYFQQSVNNDYVFADYETLSAKSVASGSFWRA